MIKDFLVEIKNKSTDIYYADIIDGGLRHATSYKRIFDSSPKLMRKVEENKEKGE